MWAACALLLAAEFFELPGSKQLSTTDTWFLLHPSSAEVRSAPRLAAAGKPALGCKEPLLAVLGAASGVAGTGAGLRAKVKRFLGTL
jgi:hypothetical protein